MIIYSILNHLDTETKYWDTLFQQIFWRWQQVIRIGQCIAWMLRLKLIYYILFTCNKDKIVLWLRSSSISKNVGIRFNFLSSGWKSLSIKVFTPTMTTKTLLSSIHQHNMSKGSNKLRSYGLKTNPSVKWVKLICGLRTIYRDLPKEDKREFFCLSNWEKIFPRSQISNCFLFCWLYRYQCLESFDQ